MRSHTGSRTGSFFLLWLRHLVSLLTQPEAGTCSGMTVGQLTSLNGFVPFPSTSLWNTDISTAPVDSNSANYINFIGSTVTPQIGLVEAGLGIAIIPSFGVLAPETAR
jgi:DNA-binding transcriptional LysR family regulator